MNEQANNVPAVTEIECPPARDPAVRWFIFAALLIGIGALCWKDRNAYPPPADWTFSHINVACNYLYNTYGAFVLVPLGAIAAGIGIRQLTRRLYADETGIGYRGQEQVAWSDVKELDATKVKKGFLFLHHGDGEVLKLDSWKIQNFRKLVEFIDKHVPAERQKR